ncbi:MAG: ABC transporter permease subunit [Pseudomonadota bacterium]
MLNKSNIYIQEKIPGPIAEAWHNFRKNILASVALIGLLVIIFLALASPLLVPYDPNFQHENAYLVQPSWMEGGNPAFIFGTDDLGRDLFSRMLMGARLTLGSAFIATVVSLSLGLVLGILTAIGPRLISTLFLRFMDMLLATPSLLIAILLTALFGATLFHATLAVAIALTPHFGRNIHQLLEEELAKPYVEAALLDVPNIFRNVFRSIFPNLFGRLAVQMMLSFSIAVLDIAALGFLGLGASADSPDWGRLLSESLDYIQIAPWTVTLPGLAIFVTVLCINLIGQGLSQALDPEKY